MYIDHALLSHLQPGHVQPLPIAYCMLARDVYAVLLQSTGVDSRRASDEGGCLQLGGTAGAARPITGAASLASMLCQPLPPCSLSSTASLL